MIGAGHGTVHLVEQAMTDDIYNKKPQRHSSKFQTTTEILHSLLQKGKSPLAHQFKRWRLWQDWPQVVGPTIAKNTLPVSYSRRNLVVWVRHPAYMQELLFVKKPLIQKINNYMGSEWIRNIHFTLDQKDVPAVEEGQELSQNLDKLK